MPASHALHVAGELEVAAAVCSVPAGHALAERQLVWFGALVYLPLAQAAQVRSVTLEPAFTTYEPASHVVHGSHVAAFDVVEYEPLAHDVHVRSTEALPSSATRWPGAQVLRCTQDVAGLPSWSQVPSAHAAFAV